MMTPNSAGQAASYTKVAEVMELLHKFNAKDLAGLSPKKIALRLLKSEQVYVNTVLATLIMEYKSKLVEVANSGKSVSLAIHLFLLIYFRF
jgi:hypothetical protein